MSFLNLFGRKDHSKNVAKERLQSVLVTDRSRLSPGMLQEMKVEVARSISKFLEVDSDNVMIQMKSQAPRKSNLVVSISLK